ncbi:MAG: response regulator [Undibacterium sp.]|nr:response regulator [Opitutaceae bacterium]
MSDTPPSGFKPYTAAPWPVSQPKSGTPLKEGAKVNDFETLSKLRHALRTPLNQIIGYTEMLMESAEEHASTNLLRDLKKIHTAGGQLLALLNDALAPWKIETGKIDLIAMRREMIVPLNSVIGFSELSGEDPKIAAIPGVADDLKKIRQAARNLFALIEGETDLGDIAAHSLSSNLGSAAEAVLGSIPTPTTRTAPFFDFLGVEKSQLATGRILVVDDDAMNREMLSRRLQKMGYKIREAENGNRALDELKQRPFDLVLLDIIMPELDGFRTLEFMKTDPMLRHVPVIMLTALDEVESTVRCIEAGAEDYVPKPFNPVILRARINASLEKKRLRDQEQAALLQLQSERTKSERLLLNVLPQAIADRLKQGERTIVDSFHECTVVFADIVGFTQIVAKYSPSRTVQLLNELFSAFDRIAETHRLEKIKTIGDSYMMVGGVPTALPEHAAACAQASLEMLENLRTFNRRYQIDWAVRIGMNSGPVIGGIIGTKKFAYDLWGETVNIASRMESHGQPWRIQLTDSTRKLLGDKFKTEERGVIEIKNAEPMRVFHLSSPV